MLHSVNGVRLNVIDEGPHDAAAGDGPTIVFLHGLGGCWRDWEPQLDLLTDRYRCVVIEHRGHGRSERTSGAYTTSLFAADAAAVCRDLGIEHCYLVGLSMGGMIAQALTLAEPQLVDALVLCDTGARMGGGMADALRQMAGSVRKHGFPDSRGVVPTGESINWAAATIANRPDIVRSNQRESESTDPDCWARAAVAVAEHDTSGDLGRIEAPVLIVWGAEDELIRVAAAQRLLDGLPHAELVVLPDAGHVCNLEQPEAFDEAIESFFAKHPAGPTA